MTKRILVTGGPVHAYLDDVKIITNKFKGGLMADFVTKMAKRAEQEEMDINITYVCSKNSVQPWWSELVDGENCPYLQCVHHNGFEDYANIVLDFSADSDVVILGAAIANLIPKEKIEGKFPSHNYRVGDTIPIEFTIAPRIINEIKRVNPKALLFGYKLLSGVDHYELIKAAYGVLLESKAVTIFANDTKDLMQKYAVTKERSVHPMHYDDTIQWVLDRMDEEYYSSSTVPETDWLEPDTEALKNNLCAIMREHRHSFIEVEEGYVFGSGAVRIEGDKNRFITTARGKKDLEDDIWWSFVTDVNHTDRKVSCGTSKKATLNAPLFYNIFYSHPDVAYILHFHHQRPDLVTDKYHVPGTDKDSCRDIIWERPSFNIEGHGCILSYSKTGQLIK